MKHRGQPVFLQAAGPAIGIALHVSLQFNISSFQESHDVNFNQSKMARTVHNRPKVQMRSLQRT